MKAMNFQDDILSIPTNKFKDQYVLAFDLTSIQGASENFTFPELVREPLRLEPHYTFFCNMLLNCPMPTSMQSFAEAILTLI